MIVRKLGEDVAGMSRLFLAEHVGSDQRISKRFFRSQRNPKHRPVVIKIADLQQQDGEFNNTALQREEQRLRTLNHPNILKIRPVAPPSDTVHETRSAEPVYSARAQRLASVPWFIVLEYLAGGSLEAYVAPPVRQDFQCVKR